MKRKLAIIAVRGESGQSDSSPPGLFGCGARLAGWPAQIRPSSSVRKGYEQNATIVRINHNCKIQLRIDRDRKLLVLRKLRGAWKAKDCARLWRRAGYGDADRGRTHIVQERHRVARRIYGDECAGLEVVVDRRGIDTYSYRGGYARKRIDNHDIILQAVGGNENLIHGIEDNAAWQLNSTHAASDGAG